MTNANILRIFFAQNICICENYIISLFQIDVMPLIPGYKEVSYSQFQKELKKAFDIYNKSFVQVAAELFVKSPNTIKNALAVHEQIVPDEKLTRLTDHIKFNACILWIAGKRKYFISNK